MKSGGIFKLCKTRGRRFVTAEKTSPTLVILRRLFVRLKRKMEVPSSSDSLGVSQTPSVSNPTAGAFLHGRILLDVFQALNFKGHEANL